MSFLIVSNFLSFIQKINKLLRFTKFEKTEQVGLPPIRKYEARSGRIFKIKEIFKSGEGEGKKKSNEAF